MEKALTLARISIRGVVQGVGFRPFVYQLAMDHALAGWVCNTSGDVKIEVEGPARQIEDFLSRIRSKAPPLARIEELRCTYGEPLGQAGFEIRSSLPEEGRYQRVSPDIATCTLCRDEVLDPGNRRYGYAFTNCTNCGPRLTIIRDIPYDRPYTTMAPFTMCSECRHEYDDPLNRRFHAQPNCCPACGPALRLTDAAGVPVHAENPIAEGAALLRNGKILALKGMGGFLLACDATSEEAVQKLRRRKRRPFKPLALMMTGVEEVRRVCSVSPEEEAVLGSYRAPIVLLRIKDGSSIATGISPNLNYLGVMLPYTPLHLLLMKEARIPLVMTSGNLSEEPIVRDDDEALEKLSSIADYFLLHNRDIHARCDDSVVLVEDREPRVIRRARGYAPDPVILPFEVAEVLACGADIKNTFCMTRDHYAFLSPHIGDMENLETLRHFELMEDLYRKLFRLNPRILAHDLHPDYLSTRYARERKAKDSALTLVPVQHHHAHIVSCMVENGIQPPVLGVGFDGTGYGLDGTLWGGEFFLAADYQTVHRIGHLETVPLPGGEAAIRKPYRMALSYLYTLLGEEVLERSLPFLEGVREVELRLLIDQIRKRIHAPMTSGAGRLFDAVSALIGVRGSIDYEGQAAVELEMVCGEIDDHTEPYPFRVQEETGEWIIRLGDLFSAILSDLDRGVPQGVVSARFHHTVAILITRTCVLLSRATGIRRVVLSGGVFQNRLLSGLTRFRMQEEGLQAVTHREIPCNDAGISLGQAVIAHFRTR